MNNCDTIPRANDLSLCAVGQYAQAPLNVGTLQYVATNVVVFFTNEATGYTHMVECEEVASLTVVVEQPEDLSPDQIYRISVAGINAVEGSGLIPFKFYTYDPTTETFVAKTTYTTAVWVKFRKLWTSGVLNQFSQQWICS